MSISEECCSCIVLTQPLLTHATHLAAYAQVKSADVKVLARLTPEVIASAKGTTTPTPTGECIVAAMQGNMIVTSFHVSQC